MTESVVIEEPGEHYRKLGFHIYIRDFANILKAFIGSNFLSIPFGFGRCGLAVGVAGLIAIGVLTGHCSHLLVKCKYHAIKHIVNIYLYPNIFSSKSHDQMKHQKGKPCFDYKLNTDHLLHPEETKQSEDVNQRKEDVLDIQRRLVKSVSYGDLARMCFGHFGVALTNAIILVTQIGFCVNYAIFTANAVQSFFPVYNCTVQLQNNGAIASPDCQYLCNSSWQAWHEELLNTSRKDKDMSCDYVSAEPAPITSLWTSTRNHAGLTSGYPKGQNHSARLVIPDTGASLSHEQSSSAHPEFARDPERMTPKLFSFSPTATSATSLDPVSSVIRASAAHSVIPTSATSASNAPVSSKSTLNSSSFQSRTTSPSLMDLILGTHTTVLAHFQSSAENVKDSVVPTSHGKTMWNETWTDSPDLRLLVLVPMAIFVILILPRRMRGLGVLSTVGNLALVSGTTVVLIALITQFHMSDTWMWARLEGLPIFFGTVASAFEGAGTMLPVEASMDGNRHNYATYLFGGLIVLVALHICTGILSYLSFGSNIAQVVSMNLDMGSWMGVTVNAFLMIGIVSTFPLMAFPVVQLAETTLLGKGRCCQKKREDSEEDQALLTSYPHHTDIESAFLQVSPWKRNVVRIFLVLVIGALSLWLRDSFAYVSAFLGALGSTFVAFILPCLFHLRLCWSRLPLFILLKDLTIVVLGVFFSVTGIYTVIMDIAM